MNKNIKRIKKNDCCGCQLCFNICPKKAITLEIDEEGFQYPTINKEKCIDCGLCYNKCPIIYNEKKTSRNISYACYSKNDNLRMNSSSGGIFGVIAKYILKNNGMVVGAAFDENNQIKHIKVEDVNNLYKLLGSKYVQSNVGEIYITVKEALINNRLVLFSGTPCQVRGLLNFLDKEYENLITIDIICHGVPSPKIWQKYLNYREKKDGEKPISISFRNKNNGWTKYRILFKYKNKELSIDHNKDLYMQSFLLNSCLRNSCYNCKFKGHKRNSDLTIGDFWGIDRIIKGLNDDKGISLLIINSEVGMKVLNMIDNDIVKYEVPYRDAIIDNKALLKSVKRPKSRSVFIKESDKNDFELLFKKFSYITPIYKKIILKAIGKKK